MKLWSVGAKRVTLKPEESMSLKSELNGRFKYAAKSLWLEAASTSSMTVKLELHGKSSHGLAGADVGGDEGVTAGVGLEETATGATDGDVFGRVTTTMTATKTATTTIATTPPMAQMIFFRCCDSALPFSLDLVFKTD